VIAFRRIEAGNLAGGSKALKTSVWKLPGGVRQGVETSLTL